MNADYECFSSPDGELVPCPLRLDNGLELACPQNFPPTEQLHTCIHFNPAFPKQESGYLQLTKGHEQLTHFTPRRLCSLPDPGESQGHECSKERQGRVN